MSNLELINIKKHSTKTANILLFFSIREPQVDILSHQCSSGNCHEGQQASKK